jgi:hypothetical protein
MIEKWMEYLYKVTLVALITRGNETVYFAFDLVLLVILFWERRLAQRLLFWGKNMEKGGGIVRNNVGEKVGWLCKGEMVPHMVRTILIAGF